MAENLKVGLGKVLRSYIPEENMSTIITVSICCTVFGYVKKTSIRQIYMDIQFNLKPGIRF